MTLAAVLATAVSSAACGPSQQKARALPAHPEAPARKVGKGYVVTVPPEGIVVGADDKHKAVKPKVTEDFEGPPTSNDWWSSLIWQFEAKEPYSYEMFPHPFALRARGDGLAVGYSDKAQINGRQYMFPYERDLVVGLAGLESPDTRVASYSDWAVTADWRSGANRLRATFGHGLPFVYFERKGDAPVSIKVSRFRKSSDKSDDKGDSGEGGDVEMWSEGGGVMAITVGGHHYGLFAPTTASWTRKGDTFSSTLDGKDYFSVAVLPDRKPETLKLFREHAYAFVTDTRVSWTYDEKKAELTTHFAVKAALKDQGKGLSPEPLLALYRHQWLHTANKLLPYEYASPRGAMKVLAGDGFETKMSFGGVLPVMPVVDSVDKSLLEKYVREVAWQSDLFPVGLQPKPDRDTYWTGKSLGKVATVMQLADQIGDRKDHDLLLRALENELQDWFDGEAPKLFYYDKTWATIVGVPTSYDSDAALNDHHFHYGYFVQAAAAIARYDAAWAKRWGSFVDMLAKDAANPSRDDTRFPFLRYMDPYAGHGWANGPAQYHDGNNEESSSEDMNFSTGLILWGAVTGNTLLRDTGIFLYATTLEAIEQYWFDADHAVFPKGFDFPCVGMVWSAGGKFDTWWDSNPIMIHGINYLPFQGGSLYLGRRPELVAREYEALMSRTKNAVYTWRDYALMYLALADGKRAAQELEKDTYLEPEFGDSRALMYTWIRALAAYGNVDASVTADAPTYAVFKNDEARSYVAYNPGAEPATVTFSDGTKLEVPPKELKETTGAAPAAGGDEAPKPHKAAHKEHKASEEPKPHEEAEAPAEPPPPPHKEHKARKASEEPKAHEEPKPHEEPKAEAPAAPPPRQKSKSGRPLLPADD
jgi:endoglucanase Acf2